MDIDPQALREVSGAPPLKPDYQLNAFIGRIYEKLGGEPEGDAKDFYRKVDLEILDAILEHYLAVWGRVGNQGRQPVPRDELKSATFDHRRQVVECYLGITTYSDLRFSAEQIDRIWPQSPRTTNDGNP